MRSLSREALEGAIDPRATDELLSSLPHTAPGDRFSDWWTSRRGYPFYAGLAKVVQPSSVFEIGVRLGYSLVSMYRGYPLIDAVVGVDAEIYIPGSQGKAFENLRAAGYAGKLGLFTASSHVFKPGPEVFDLVHVDGDHTFQGAMQDIAKAWPLVGPNGIMVVDDTSYIGDVKAAVESIRKSLVGVVSDFFFESFRGCWVAVRG